MIKQKRLREAREDLTEAPWAYMNCYEGDKLDDLLTKIKRSIALAKDFKGDLPEKIWIKQQFAIGVNEVTRVLERMPLDGLEVPSTEKHVGCSLHRAPLVPLQAVVVASDCNPRWLTKHIPSLASSRQVPVILLKDHKQASLRLGELVNLKTAMALGIKARHSKINEAMDALLPTAEGRSKTD